ncbi:hypothetical protein B0J14DRAFT_121158 [Halenospora varia]|nr:hypothetical protein B0J14DRAFT_121158 [Halenospora varia]
MIHSESHISYSLTSSRNPKDLQIESLTISTVRIACCADETERLHLTTFSHLSKIPILKKTSNTMPTALETIVPRSLTTDNKLNIIFGVLAATISTLGCLLAWAAYKLAYTRRTRQDEDYELSNLDRDVLRPVPSSSTSGRGCELTLRIGRSS